MEVLWLTVWLDAEAVGRHEWLEIGGRAATIMEDKMKDNDLDFGI